MRVAIVGLGVLLAVGCGPLQESEYPVGLDVADAPAPLTESGDDALFYLRYCKQQVDGPRFRVSRLMTSVEARQTQYSNAWRLRYELTVDVDGDGRFGPGDVITVSENGRNTFDQSTVGIFKVSLLDTEVSDGCPVGAADWDAR